MARVEGTLHKYVVITDDMSAPGFMLSGLDVISLADPGEADKAVTEVLDDPEVGLVALNDLYIRHLSQRVRHRVERSSMPVVVPFPNMASIRAADVESYLSSVIAGAIGYRIKLRS